jgi:carbamoyl-phosphate synthase small subunit
MSTPNPTPDVGTAKSARSEAPIARLALADGSVFTGLAFGAVGKGIVARAEVVFNTATSGYQESLTDPSYTGQILVQTFPLIGNTGTNPEDVESGKVQVSGLVVRELAHRHSNFRADMDLSSYLARYGVLGIAGVDTRAITKKLRTTGSISGVLTDRSDLSAAQLVEMARTAPSMAGQNLVPLVGCSTKAPWEGDLGEWKPAAAPSHDESKPRFRVAALDCGAKSNILRNLTERGCEVVLVPHDTPAATLRDQHASGQIDGIFISNGPGDPAAVEKTIGTLRALMDSKQPAIPMFGICLGHQLLALAAGAKTYKLKFGHRGINHPILNTESGRVEITSQNHGFAVEPKSLEAAGGVLTHRHLNDGTVAGFRMKDRPVFSVQYHPEASPGPHDAGYLFDAFVAAMSENRAEATAAGR